MNMKTEIVFKLKKIIISGHSKSNTYLINEIIYKNCNQCLATLPILKTLQFLQSTLICFKMHNTCICNEES